MRTKFHRALFGAAALAVASGGLLVSNPAQAAPPGTTPNGSVTLSPSTGATLGAISLTPNPNPAFCPGDTTTGGYTWQTFISNRANDPATFTYGAGPSVPAIPSISQPLGGTGFTAPLVSTVGQTLANRNTGAFVAGLGGQVTPLVGINLNAYGAALVPGAYNIGYACSLAGATTSYWSTPITITAAGGYALGAVPTAPVLTTSSVLATSATVNFTHALSTPVTTGYTATVTPTAPAGAALAPISVPGGATSFTVPGLTTGTVYSVSLTATNTTGASPASNTQSFTPSAAAQPAIQPSFTPGVGGGTVTIPGVSIGGARTAVPSSYSLTVSPAPTGSNPASFNFPTVVAGTPITQVVNGLTPGMVYTFSLAPTYASPDNGPQPPSDGTFVTGTSNNAQVIQQRITVTRPVGQLILTQRCGVNGDLEAVPLSPGFPGFPTPLGSFAASTDKIGTSPDVTPNGVFPTGAGSFADTFNNTPFNATTSPTGDADPQFNNYPFPSPATYPTECGVNLGEATIVSSGPLAGQFFQASGYINEVTVSDLRDTDLGWEVRGQMSDFVGAVKASTNVIDGDFLGWNPEVNFTTPTTGNGYTQTVLKGDPVLPGAGTTGTAGTGLGSGKRLAQATPSLGLGVARMDARLRMLIPTTAKNDTYTGIMNFTVLDFGNGTTP